MLTSLPNQLMNWLLPPLCVHCSHEGQWLCQAAHQQLAMAPTVEAVKLVGCQSVYIRAGYDCPPLKAFIQRLKYSNWTAAEELLGELLRPLESDLARLPKTSTIVPVPLHPRRQRARGFNQSELIARAVGKITGRPLVPVLRRTRDTETQTALSADERQKNVADAFTAVAELPTDTWLLVDDVITTGATMTACAQALRRRGARYVFACALAKG
ncbi:MAG: ComF family protein [Candidatus Kerfeldbacteria bacterium]|nr:ComF family protein [Candidatus Kerfeldbacteria bacterium]